MFYKLEATIFTGKSLLSARFWVAFTIKFGLFKIFILLNVLSPSLVGEEAPSVHFKNTTMS